MWANRQVQWNIEQNNFNNQMKTKTNDKVDELFLLAREKSFHWDEDLLFLISNVRRLIVDENIYE